MQKARLQKVLGAIMAVSLCLGLVFVAISCDGGGSTPGGCGGIEPPPTGQVDCSGSNPLPVPDEMAELGPYPVASRYVFVTNPNTPRTNRYYNVPFRVQILYPTTAQAVAGMTKKELNIDDVRYYIPDVDPGNNIPPVLPTDYYELANEDIYKNDNESTNYLPMDTAHGPYPLIMMVHGTTSSTISHYTMVTHWASRGFVVVIADYNGICMKDMLKSFSTFMSHREMQDTEFLMDAVKAQSGVFAFLKGNIDTKRIGISGHSWGGKVAGEMAGTPGVRVSIPQASIGVSDSPEILSALLLGAQEDGVLNYQIDTVAGYNATKARKRLVGIPRAGHMAFADVCDIVALAEDYGVYLDPMIKAMATDGCNDPEADPSTWHFIDEHLSMDIVIYATTAAFEETLQCSESAGKALDNIKSHYGNPSKENYVPDLEYRSSPPTPNNTNRMPDIGAGLFR